MEKASAPVGATCWAAVSSVWRRTGAQIKNIALNAAYQAAAGGGTLRMEHLVWALFQERQKEGKVMLASEFGEYGVMLSEQLTRGQPGQPV